MHKINFPTNTLSRQVVILVMILLFLSLAVTSVLAQDPVAEGSATGGAAYDPNMKVPLTPQQQKELDQKHALVEQIWKLKKEGYSDNEIRRVLDLPKTPSPDEFSPTPKGGSYNYGYSYMGLWKEPESEPNWCGPGSGKAVISNWTSPPTMQYLAENACKVGESPPNCTGMMSGNVTYAHNWAHIVNDEIGTTWYELKNPTSVADYKGYLEVDIYWNSHPLNNVVKTSGLAGWGSYNTAHYVAANRYNFPDNLVYYGDTAPNSASPNGNPFGWHAKDIDVFYNNHIAAQYNLIIW